MPYFFSNAAASGPDASSTSSVVYQVTRPSRFAASISACDAAWAALAPIRQAAAQKRTLIHRVMVVLRVGRASGNLRRKTEPPVRSAGNVGDGFDQRKRQLL